VGKRCSNKNFLKQSVLPTVVEEFIKEVRILSVLRHPNVILFMGACVTPNLCIVTEFLQKGSLHNILFDGEYKFSWDLQLRICLDTALGINYLHRMGVLHLDLKSHNLLLDDNWNVKVCDFGISEFRNSSQDKRKTISTTLQGTVGWMSPELIQRQNPTEKSDVFSFGIVMWEIASHKMPFNNYTDEIGIEAAIVRGERLEIPDDVTNEYSNLMQKCWANEPSERPTFDSIIQDLSSQISPAPNFEATSTRVAPKVVRKIPVRPTV